MPQIPPLSYFQPAATSNLKPVFQQHDQRAQKNEHPVNGTLIFFLAEEYRNVRK